MIELWKIVNDEFKFIDYGVRSKMSIYLKMGFMIKDRIKRAIKKVAKITWEQFKESSFDMGILVLSRGRVSQVLVKGGPSES